MESQSGNEKITYECGCVEKESQDIIWGFVLSERREQSPTPKLRESPPPFKPRSVGPRVKVVMQRKDIRAIPTISFPTNEMSSMVTQTVLPDDTTTSSPQRQTHLANAQAPQLQLPLPIAQFLETIKMLSNGQMSMTDEQFLGLPNPHQAQVIQKVQEYVQRRLAHQGGQAGNQQTVQGAYAQAFLQQAQRNAAMPIQPGQTMTPDQQRLFERTKQQLLGNADDLRHIINLLQGFIPPQTKSKQYSKNKSPANNNSTNSNKAKPQAYLQWPTYNSPRKQHDPTTSPIFSRKTLPSSSRGTCSSSTRQPTRKSIPPPQFNNS
jgi:hypothetical protein